MSRYIGILLLAPGLFQASGNQTSLSDKDRAAEIEWVKGSTTEFLGAILSWQTGDLVTSPVTYLGPELAAAEKEAAGDSGLVKVAWQFLGGKFRFVGAEMSPNASEILLRGELIPASEQELKKLEEKLETDFILLKVFGLIGDLGPKSKSTADFTIRVARDSSGGRWLIRSMSVKIRDEKGPTSPKK